MGIRFLIKKKKSRIAWWYGNFCVTLRLEISPIIL